MVDEKLIKNKVAQLAEYYTDLQETQDVKLDIFKADKKIRRYVERTLHLCIECCLDIGNHIIADNGWREPLDNKDIFAVLAENNVLSMEILSNLQKMAQFRNVLVHDYAKIDPEIVFVILKKDLSDIQKFIQDINSLL